MMPVIAIDGPSASGKGTIARRLAAHFDFAWLDTGLLYRAVGMTVLQTGGDPEDAAAATRAAQALDFTAFQHWAEDSAIRSGAAGVAASKVAVVPEVRAALLKFQKDFAAHPPGNKRGAVLDGRDIGTVIAPQASVKIYVTADVAARASRRFKELQGRGEAVREVDVFADLEARDARDRANQATVPAKPSEDTVTIDTTYLTAEEAFAAALRVTEEKLGSF